MNSLLAEWSRVLLGSLADAGVRDVVLSPGSRSTPFMIAAAREPRLRCHDSLDERSAAFFALGQARVSGRPSLLLCTSGSAGTHYLPAIVEANAAQIPLLILTADRPVELQECGAAQTIDQIKLFGSHARRFFDLGMPDPSLGSLRALRRMAAQASLATLWPMAGAVHLNARARKPLEPHAPSTDEERALEGRARALLAEPIVHAAPPRQLPSIEAVKLAAETCKGARRGGLIVLGPAPLAHAEHRARIFALAKRLGFPILPEAPSQLRFSGEVPAGVVVGDAFDTFLRAQAFAKELRPDVILEAGTPTSTSYERYVGTTTARRIVLSTNAWTDPPSSASMMLFGQFEEVVDTLLHELGNEAPRAPLPVADLVARANELAWRAVDEELASAGPSLTEGQVARSLVAAIPKGGHLFVGNSLPIRHVDGYAAGKSSTARVLSQRGTNGIDGQIAGALGSASLLDGPLTLFLGDVSFLHDVSSLALARGAHVPVTLVVTQNRGGRIFEQLPLATFPGVEPGVFAHVTTPHEFDLEHATKLYGVGFARATNVAELDAALAAASSGTKGRVTLVEAMVPPHGAIEQNKRMWARAESAIDALVAAGTS